MHEICKYCMNHAQECLGKASHLWHRRCSPSGSRPGRTRRAWIAAAPALHAHPRSPHHPLQTQDKSKFWLPTTYLPYGFKNRHAEVEPLIIKTAYYPHLVVASLGRHATAEHVTKNKGVLAKMIVNRKGTLCKEGMHKCRTVLVICHDNCLHLHPILQPHKQLAGAAI